MSARQKLNQANFKAALVGGLVVGWLFQSFTAFVLATFLFVVASFYSGDIRLGGDYHYPSPPSPPSRPPMSQLLNRRRSRKWRN
ncbi:hypothetical protein LBMAG52_05070 [Planctomycetia bacterium]|nr:hypothetical protein LBMAG52_05070 [Planctomycetia bacterium]